MRCHCIYLVNTPKGIEKIVNVFKQFLRKKISDRVHFILYHGYKSNCSYKLFSFLLLDGGRRCRRSIETFVTKK